MPIGFARNVLTESFAQVFLSEPDFEFRAGLVWAGLGWALVWAWGGNGSEALGPSPLP